MFTRFLILLAALILPATVQAAPPKNWADTVTLTPEGAHVFGNPAAKTRLVEYVSYTCPHCAHFVAEGTGPLKTGWVAKGIVAVEVRNLVRDPYDLVAAILARCGGPARFAGNHEAIFAAQEGWFEKLRAFQEQGQALPDNASHAAILTNIADKTGMIALMAKRGVSPAQSKACLADEKTINLLLAMTKRAMDDKVTGTPSFLVNGKLMAAHDWASLQQLLPAPGK